MGAPDAYDYDSLCSSKNARDVRICPVYLRGSRQRKEITFAVVSGRSARLRSKLPCGLAVTRSVIVKPGLTLMIAMFSAISSAAIAVAQRSRAAFVVP